MTIFNFSFLFVPLSVLASHGILFLCFLLKLRGPGAQARSSLARKAFSAAGEPEQ